MAPGEAAPSLLGRRRGPARSLSFLFLGGLTLVTLCLFTSRLPGLQQITSPKPPAGEGGPTVVSAMTSSAAAPHQESHAPGRGGASEAQMLLDFVQKQRENQLQDHKMEYGTNKHPAFKDDPPQLIRDLPQEHIPVYTPPSPTDGPDGRENKTNGKRLVIVGDVHGHLAALKALLDKISFDHRHGDHLVFAGDMVTKGPDSKGVVKLAMDIGASAVRGNQDDKVLAAAREIHRLSLDDESRLGPEAHGDDADTADRNDHGDDEAEIKTRRKDHARRIARSLTRAQLAWLRSLPIILRIGRLPDATSPPWNATTLAVIHAGLVPGVQLEKQDPWAVMNMRSLVYPRKGKGKHHAQPAFEDNEQEDEEDEEDDEVDETTSQLDDLTLGPDAVAVPIEGRDGEPWSHAWNRYQNNLPPSSPRTLAIYGHDAKAGLQVNPEVDISPYDPSSSSSPSSSDDNNNHRHHNNNNKKEKKNKKHKHNPKKNKNKKKKKGLRYAYGLDSGCGHSRQLTALILSAGPAGVQHRIEQVECSSDTDTRSRSGGDDPGRAEEEEEERQRPVG